MHTYSLRITGFSLLLALSGCTSTQLNDFQKQLADIGGSVVPQTQQLGSSEVIRSEITNAVNVTTDVDTAAMRLKRHYGFSTDEEISAARNSGKGNAGWVATAISEGTSWSAQTGSYYRMSRIWTGNDRLTIEVFHQGTGSQIVSTYRSSNPKHLTEKWTERLWSQIPDVAQGINIK